MPGAKITMGGFLEAQPARVQQKYDAITGLRERLALYPRPGLHRKLQSIGPGQLPRKPTASHDAFSTPPMIHITIARPFDNDLLHNALIFCLAEAAIGRWARYHAM